MARRWAALLTGLLALAAAAAADKTTPEWLPRAQAIARGEHHRDATAAAARPQRAPTESFYLTMRDGVRLWTLLWLPEDVSEPIATVMMRTPYYTDPESGWATTWNGRGFAYIEQDQRGSGDSRDDRFQLWRMDGPDTYDTMEWIAAQPWSNGRVFTMGGSANGVTQLAGMTAEPPWFKGMAPMVASMHGHKTVYDGGAFRTGLVTPWMLALGFPDTLLEVMQHEGDTEYWDPINIPGNEHTCHIPGVHQGGWWDIFVNEQIDGWHVLQYDAPDENCRGHHYLVIEPQGHCQYGEWPNSTSTPFFHDLTAYLFYRENGMPIPPDLQARADATDWVTLYVMAPEGSTAGNYWTTLPHFPPATDATYYLAADGVLASTPPVAADNASITFTYDPDSPVRTIGGRELALPCGPRDQREVENRTDVLLFTSAPAAEPVAFVGKMTATLHVATDQADTDFSVKLTDVYPDGRSILWTDGIVRLRWRERVEEPLPVVPGEVYEVHVDLSWTAYVLEPGHSIRVAISSSNFPRFDRNPNTGEPIAQPDGEGRVARNTVFFDATRPSRITLPRVDFAEIPNNYEP